MVPASPSGSFVGSIRNTRRSSPTSIVNGRAPPNVAKTSTRSAVVSPWGTDANPAVTTRRPGPTLPASMLRPSREEDRGSPSAIEVWATRPRAESNAGTDPGGANATGLCIGANQEEGGDRARGRDAEEDLGGKWQLASERERRDDPHHRTVRGACTTG